MPYILPEPLKASFLTLSNNESFVLFKTLLGDHFLVGKTHFDELSNTGVINDFRIIREINAGMIDGATCVLPAELEQTVKVSITEIFAYQKSWFKSI